MLYVGMSTELLPWTKYEMRFWNLTVFVLLNLVLLKIATIEVKAVKLYFESIIEKATVELRKPTKKTQLEEFLKFMIVDVCIDHFTLLVI